MVTQFKSLIQVLDYFKSEETCKAYLANARWGTEPACPHCGNVGAYVTNRGFKCKAKECGKKFSVTTGTIFENTKISLRTWFAAMYLCTAHKKGISSLQLSRDLNITQKTAWFLLHRIREMLINNKAQEQLNGIVEIDETYVGGKERNKHAHKRQAKGTTGAKGKSPMVGLLERNGKLLLKVIDADKANGLTIQPIVKQYVNKDSIIITDGFGAYKGLNTTFKGHEIVRHDKDEYVRENWHTNTIEGFWAILKRGIFGIYHCVSHKHLQRYCNEFGYRYNSRSLSDVIRFEDAVKQVENARLTYANLIADGKEKGE